MTDPLRLPFDVYQRYRLVTDVLERLRPEGGRLRVLDVGGRTGILREFDRVDRVDLVDVEAHEGMRGLVLGDGTRLPYRDGAFDVVCAFDTLEHVPPPLRSAFVGECARVARGWVVLAGPCDAPEVARAEELLESFMAEKLDYRHRYLSEHRSYGLPDRAAVENQLREAGATVQTIGHGNLERWLALMCLAMYMDLDPALRELASSFYEFYNARLYASDHRPPVYRHAIVATLPGAREPDLGHLLDEPVAPAGAVEPFRELAEELLAFDREREAWRRERADYRQSVSDLEVDLEGHEASLAELRQVHEGRQRDHERTVGELRAELAAQERTVAALAGQLEEARAGLAAAINRAEQAEDRLAASEGMLAETREVLAARDARVAELEGYAALLEERVRSHEKELSRWPMAALRRVIWLFAGRPPAAG